MIYLLIAGLLWLALCGAGWAAIGLVSGRGCTDAAAWDEPVTGLWCVVSAILVGAFMLLVL